MIYVAQVESTLKGTLPYKLGPKTLILGVNGSGKSAITGAVELALTGRVSDLFGREDVARESDLMALAPGRKASLIARAILSDGSVCSYETSGSSSKAKKAKHSLPPSVDVASALPLRMVRDAVKGSADTARKFFLQRVVGNVSGDDLLSRLPGNLHEPFKRLAPRGISDGAAVLLAVIEAAKKHGRDAESNASGGREVLDRTTNSLAAPPTAEQLVEAKERMSAAHEAVTTLAQRAAKAAYRQDAEAGVKNIEMRLVVAQSRVEDLSAAIESQPPDAAPLGPEWRALLDVLRWAEAQGLSTCPICRHDVEPQTIREFLPQVEGVVASEGRPSLRAQGEVALRMVRNEITMLTSQLQAARQVLGANVDPVSPEVYSEARESLRLSEEHYQRLSQIETQWATLRATRDQAARSEEDGDAYKRLAKACSEVVAELLDASVEKFSIRVRSFLPPEDRFVLRLRDGAREVFQMGFEREGGVHTALSGAEWARMTAAVAAAMVEPGKLQVIIPEDRAFDPDTLEAVLKAFSNVPAQVILAHPIAPRNVPKGWTVVVVGKRAKIPRIVRFEVEEFEG
jgi:hypothetical protein